MRLFVLRYQITSTNSTCMRDEPSSVAHQHLSFNYISDTVGELLRIMISGLLVGRTYFRFGTPSLKNLGVFLQNFTKEISGDF